MAEETLVLNYGGLQTGKIACGSVEGNGAEAIDIEVGFRPKYVRLINPESMVLVEWFDGMDSDKGIQLANGSDNGNTVVIFEALSADGVSVNERGFTIGNGDINANEETIFFFVLG